MIYALQAFAGAGCTTQSVFSHPLLFPEFLLPFRVQPCSHGFFLDLCSVFVQCLPFYANNTPAPPNYSLLFCSFIHQTFTEALLLARQSAGLNLQSRVKSGK